MRHGCLYIYLTIHIRYIVLCSVILYIGDFYVYGKSNVNPRAELKFIGSSNAHVRDDVGHAEGATHCDNQAVEAAQDPVDWLEGFGHQLSVQDGLAVKWH